jgi:hypothetical protein
MDPVIQIVNRSNQRGGRMLSVVDLIEAGTLTQEQTAWLLARIQEGSSWLVGAVPGGAGKTTVMSALLAMLPGDEEVYLTNRGSGWERCGPGTCAVSYEIGTGFYDAYIWGGDVRLLTEISMKGGRIVSNLHADTLEQARDQIVRKCGASEKGLGAFDLFLPMVVSRRGFTPKRMVEYINYYEKGNWKKLHDIPALSSREKKIAEFLAECVHQGLRTCPDVRTAWLKWNNSSSQ